MYRVPAAAIVFAAVLLASVAVASADWRDRSSSGGRWSDRTPDNLPPVVDYDPAVNTQDAGVVSGDLNATDPEGGPLTFTVLEPAHDGTVVINPDGSFMYTPTAELAETGGTDEFKVRVSDEPPPSRWRSRLAGPLHTVATISVEVLPALTIVDVPVGAFPAAVAFSPDGSRAFVANSSGCCLTVIDTAANTGTNIPGIIGVAIAISPDGEAYLVNADNDTVYVIDTDTIVVVDTFTVGDFPSGVAVAVTSGGTAVYVTNQGSNTVSVIDPATNALITTVNVGNGPAGIVASPDGTRVYVAIQGGAAVMVIDTETNAVIATVNVGASPWQVAVSPDGSRVYVANESSETVSVIQTTNNTVIDTIVVGDGPNDVAVSLDGERVYVVHDGGDSLTVINAITNSVIRTIPMSDPYGVAVGPDGRVYVTRLLLGTVSVITFN